MTFAWEQLESECPNKIVHVLNTKIVLVVVTRFWVHLMFVRISMPLFVIRFKSTCCKQAFINSVDTLASPSKFSVRKVYKSYQSHPFLYASVHFTHHLQSAMASQMTGVLIVCLTVCSGADLRKHQSSASLAFVRGIYRWQVDSSHKGPVMRIFFIDDFTVINYNGNSPDVSLAFTYSNRAVSLGYINDTYDPELCDKCWLMKILGRNQRLLYYTEYIIHPEIIIQMPFITMEIIGLIRCIVWHNILPDLTLNVLNCIKN